MTLLLSWLSSHLVITLDTLECNSWSIQEPMPQLVVWLVSRHLFAVFVLKEDTS